MKKVFTQSFIRSLEQQVAREEITHSRMVEIINEKADEAISTAVSLNGLMVLIHDTASEAYGWISVEKRLPEQTSKQGVQVFCYDQGLVHGYTFFKNGAFYELLVDIGDLNIKKESIKPSHWMSVPERPKE